VSGQGMALGIVAGIGFSMLTEGLALGPITSLLANMAGDALIGAGSELAANGIDGQRVNGSQVGIAAGAGALMGLLFNGAGVIGSKHRFRFPSGPLNVSARGKLSCSYREQKQLRIASVTVYDCNRLLILFAFVLFTVTLFFPLM
jgi:hypothetical protein